MTDQWPDTSIDTSPVPLTLRDVAAAVLLGVILAVMLSFLMQRNAELENQVKTVTKKAALDLCETISRHDCDVLDTTQEYSLVNGITHAKSVRQAVESIRLQSVDEQSALRLIALVRAIQSESWPEKSNNNAWEIARDALSASWLNYPKLTTASQCYWCNYHDSNMYEWFTNSRANDDYLKSLIEYTPHLFGQFSDQVTASFEKHQIAVRQSMLASHGNRHGFLGKTLYEQQDWKALRVLVANTNSAAPIMGLDWSKIPNDIVKLSWQQGIRAGDDLPNFTDQLMRLGYRPALRWTMWLVAKGKTHPSLRRMSRYVNAYQNLLKNNTDFNMSKGESFADFYDAHWRRITFDNVSKKWVVR